MSSRTYSLFIGRIPRDVRIRELEDIFSRYGPLSRCDIKYSGTGSAFGFVDFEDRRDAEDAVRYENGRRLHDYNIVVEWAKTPTRPGYRDEGKDRGGRGGNDRERGIGRYGDREYRGGDRDRRRDRSPDRRRDDDRDRRRKRSPTPDDRSKRRRSQSPRRDRDEDRDRKKDTEKEREGSSKKEERKSASPKDDDKKKSRSRSQSPARQKNGEKENGNEHAGSHSRSRSPSVNGNGDVEADADLNETRSRSRSASPVNDGEQRNDAASRSPSRSP